MQQVLNSTEGITTLTNNISSDINTDVRSSLKKPWPVGPNIVVVIDKSLVKRLGISEDNTLFQQELVEGGILLRIIRRN